MSDQHNVVGGAIWRVRVGRRVGGVSVFTVVYWV